MSLESHNGSIDVGQSMLAAFGGEPVGELPVSELPRRIALLSKCVCGDTLTLTDHTLTRRNAAIDFEGIFACRGCNDAMFSKASRIVGAFWRKTRKIEAVGLKYEKEG